MKLIKDPIQKPFINLSSLSNFESTKNGDFEEQYKPISNLIGAKNLSFSISIVPAGKKSCPFHNHHINEELFLILEGEGTLRFGDKTYSIKKDDIISCPPGGKDLAHQIINTSSNDLKYLCLSTNKPYDICEYPDSNKILALDKKNNSKLRLILEQDKQVDYFLDEE